MRTKIFVFFFFIGTFLYAQTNFPGDKKVTLDASNQPLPVIFKKIEAQTSYRFSYPAGLISSTRLVSIHAKEKSLSQVLEILLPEGVGYQFKSNYIILSKKSIGSTRANPVIVSGYIRDITTDSVLPDVSISMTSRMVN